MKKAGALASALRSSGATVAAPSEVPESNTAEHPAPAPKTYSVQPSRVVTKPITVHYPEEVRRQLKMLAAEEGRQMDDMVAEALNLLFVKYRKPELVPRKASK